MHEPDGRARTWEVEASLEVRSGTVAALDAYRRHGRLAVGTPEQMIATDYRPWKADRVAGLDSLLVGPAAPKS